MLKIGLGTAAIGRPQYINIRQESPASFEMATFRQNGKKVLSNFSYLLLTFAAL